MKQVIVFVRCSTEKQEIQSQIDETTAYAMSFGYKKEQIIVIGAKGASAVKLNDIYLEKINELFDTINKGNIEAVFVYHLNRIARNEEMAMRVKSFLIYKRIQLYIKEPTICLLNDDGSVNAGAELCFALFATMAKQNAEELKAKTARARKRDKEAGLWLGTPIPFGYTVVKKRFLVDDDKAKVVRLIYQLYATGKYSYASLAKEMTSRGIQLYEGQVDRILGYSKYWDGTLPIIINNELHLQVDEVKENNRATMPRSSHQYFANRIIRCSCGYGYSAKNFAYRCCRCNSEPQIAIKALDGLLWLVASNFEGIHRNKQTKEEINEKQAVLERKIKAVDTRKAKVLKTQERAKEAYLEGIIDLDEYKGRTQTSRNEIKDLENKLVGYKNELEILKRPVTNRVEELQRIADHLQSSDEAEMRAIVRTWVKRITINEGIITIDTPIRTYQCVYKPKGNQGRFTTLFGGWLNVPMLIRADNSCKLDSTCFPITPERLVTTLAWLGGNEIV